MSLTSAMLLAYGSIFFCIFVCWIIPYINTLWGYRQKIKCYENKYRDAILADAPIGGDVGTILAEEMPYFRRYYALAVRAFCFFQLKQYDEHLNELRGEAARIRYRIAELNAPWRFL
jgi:hypothetical protein